jgi:hypothetical protein
MPDAMPDAILRLDDASHSRRAIVPRRILVAGL